MCRIHVRVPGAPGRVVQRAPALRGPRRGLCWRRRCQPGSAAGAAGRLQRRRSIGNKSKLKTSSTGEHF